MKTFHKRERESRPEGDYQGSIDWTSECREWAKQSRSQLDGMANALGLSLDERKTIDEDVKAKRGD